MRRPRLPPGTGPHQPVVGHRFQPSGRLPQPSFPPCISLTLSPCPLSRPCPVAVDARLGLWPRVGGAVGSACARTAGSVVAWRGRGGLGAGREKCTYPAARGGRECRSTAPSPRRGAHRAASPRELAVGSWAGWQSAAGRTGRPSCSFPPPLPPPHALVVCKGGGRRRRPSAATAGGGGLVCAAAAGGWLGVGGGRGVVFLPLLLFGVARRGLRGGGTATATRRGSRDGVPGQRGGGGAGGDSGSVGCRRRAGGHRALQRRCEPAVAVAAGTGRTARLLLLCLLRLAAAAKFLSGWVGGRSERRSVPRLWVVVQAGVSLPRGQCRPRGHGR